MTRDVLLTLHDVGACVLLGTGAGIAFFMAASHRSRDPRLVAHVAGIVVLADWAFTATAAAVQPVTGYLLAKQAGWPLTEGWLALALVLYVLVGALWLPVVWMQARMRNLAERSRDRGEALPPAYFRLYGFWFASGVPAFLMVLAIVWLMIAKPF